MDSVAEMIFDTVIAFLILILCFANLLNFIGYLMYEETFGFGTLKEKSSIDVEYTVPLKNYTGYRQMDYYMLPIVDIQDTRTISKLDGTGSFTYSNDAGTDTSLKNMYNKIIPVLNNTEYTGGIDKLDYSISIDQTGTVIFKKERVD